MKQQLTNKFIDTRTYYDLHSTTARKLSVLSWMLIVVKAVLSSISFKQNSTILH